MECGSAGVLELQQSPLQNSSTPSLRRRMLPAASDRPFPKSGHALPLGSASRACGPPKPGFDVCNHAASSFAGINFNSAFTQSHRLGDLRTHRIRELLSRLFIGRPAVRSETFAMRAKVPRFKPLARRHLNSAGPLFRACCQVTGFGVSIAFKFGKMLQSIHHCNDNSCKIAESLARPLYFAVHYEPDFLAADSVEIPGRWRHEGLQRSER